MPSQPAAQDTRVLEAAARPRRAGIRKRVLPGRVLTWSTELGIASGALELFIEKGARKILEPRMVYIIRMQVSFAASCPYAIDVNSWTYKDHAITGDEIRAMRGELPIDEAATFSDREKAALKYARAMSGTPPRFGEVLLTDLRRLFSHDEIIAVAALAAKVNFWARFIESQRIKPAGYTEDPQLGLAEYRTWEGGAGQ